MSHHRPPLADVSALLAMSEQCRVGRRRRPYVETLLA